MKAKIAQCLMDSGSEETEAQSFVLFRQKRFWKWMGNNNEMGQRGASAGERGPSAAGGFKERR